MQGEALDALGRNERNHWVTRLLGLAGCGNESQAVAQYARHGGIHGPSIRSGIQYGSNMKFDYRTT